MIADVQYVRNPFGMFFAYIQLTLMWILPREGGSL